MKFIGTALLISALAAPVMAQRPQRGENRSQRRERVRQIDANNDGRISRDEWKRPSEGFNRIDANGDGYITREELTQARAGRGGRGSGANPRDMDADNDGKISQNEWKGPSEMFDRIDANNDGFITGDELRQNRPGAGGRGRGEAFSRMDANKDGKISKDEWKGRSEMFNRLDANSDGFITQEELRAKRKR